MRNFVGAGLIALIYTMASGDAIAQQRGSIGGTISLKKRLHVNTLITEPGTIEVDWASAYSFTNDGFLLPASLKFTPAGRHVWWGRTEYSLSFNSYDSGAGNFGQTATLLGTCVLKDGEILDIAIAPQVTVFLRDGSGVRMGGTAIARWDVGRNSIGTTLGWTGASRSSPSNPAGTLDYGAGFGRRLAPGGALGHFSPHANFGLERSTGFSRILSYLEGVEYQIVDQFAFDVSFQQVAALRQPVDRQIVLGITANLGRPR